MFLSIFAHISEFIFACPRLQLEHGLLHLLSTGFLVLLAQHYNDFLLFRVLAFCLFSMPTSRLLISGSRCDLKYNDVIFDNIKQNLFNEI